MTATAINLVASSNADLLDKVYAFMTTNTDLVTAGEEWVSDEYVAGESFIIHSVQAGDTQDIYIGWKISDSAGTDVYNIEIRGFGGYTAGGILWEQQPDTMTQSVYLCSYNQNLNYWIVANHRRFIVVEKVSTVYLSCYCGLYTAYATPLQNRYPMYVAASTYTEFWRWSELTAIAGAQNPVGSSDTIVSAYMRSTSGWQPIRCRNATDAVLSGEVSIHPYHHSLHRQDIRNDIDGSYTVDNSVIFNNVNSAIEGFLDGMGWVTGFQLTAESTVTFDGNTWLIVQDVYRTDIKDYYAVRLL